MRVLATPFGQGLLIEKRTIVEKRGHLPACQVKELRIGILRRRVEELTDVDTYNEIYQPFVPGRFQMILRDEGARSLNYSVLAVFSFLAALTGPHLRSASRRE